MHTYLPISPHLSPDLPRPPHISRGRTMHATVFERRPTTVAKLSSQPLVLTRCSEHTARCRPPAPRLASSARGPDAHLGYRTTHGTEPTLGSTTLEVWYT